METCQDRIAKAMVLAAEADGKLTPGKPGTVVEGTGGNTGVLSLLEVHNLRYRSTSQCACI